MANHLLTTHQILHFLQHHWQRQHKVFRHLLHDYPLPFSMDELAGMACEDGVDARIVRQYSGQSGRSGDWEVIYGPLPESIFAELGERQWLLLVNGIDRLVDGFHALLDSFGFLPAWRFDDIMISYGVEGGSVGPHDDHYDVFLIQLQGVKRWHIAYGGDRELIPNLPVKVLKHFEAEHSWDMHPGDVLYLPPNVAHHGVGLGENITLSIGFRAPDKKQLLTHYLNETHELDLYRDPGIAMDDHGLISREALQRLLQFVKQPVVDDDEFIQWFGAYMSETDEQDWPAPSLSRQQIITRLRQGAGLRRHRSTRIFYFFDRQNLPWLAINGQTLPLQRQHLPWAKQICNRRILPPGTMPVDDEAFIQLIQAWIVQGYFLLLEAD